MLTLHSPDSWSIRQNPSSSRACVPQYSLHTIIDVDSFISACVCSACWWAGSWQEVVSARQSAPRDRWPEQAIVTSGVTWDTLSTVAQIDHITWRYVLRCVFGMWVESSNANYAELADWLNVGILSVLLSKAVQPMTLYSLRYTTPTILYYTILYYTLLTTLASCTNQLEYQLIH